MMARLVLSPLSIFVFTDQSSDREVLFVQYYDGWMVVVL